MSLRRSEERRRLTLLREDSERSHSLPREAELCHYERKHSQPTPSYSLPRKLAQPPFKAHFWALPSCWQPLPRPPDAEVSGPCPYWLPRMQWIQGAPGGAEGCPWGCDGLREAGQGAAQTGGHERWGSGGKE